MSDLETAAAEHRRVLLYERRAAEARERRDEVIRQAMAEGARATTIGRALGLTEGAVRKIASTTEKR